MPDLNRFPHPVDDVRDVPVFVVDRNVGHGRVFPRPDGTIARCGGPALCLECQKDEGKRATAEALWSGADDAPQGSRPEFDRALVDAFKTRGDAFPSTDGRLWTRVLLGGPRGISLAAWDRDGNFYLWGSVEELAAAALEIAAQNAR